MDQRQKPELRRKIILVFGVFAFILGDLRSGQLPPEIVAQCQLWGFEDLSLPSEAGRLRHKLGHCRQGHPLAGWAGSSAASGKQLGFIFYY